MIFYKQNDPSRGSYQSNRQYNHALYSDIEKKTMKYEGFAKNPVIVIHGFLGAKLHDTIKDINIWGDFNSVDLLKGYSHQQLRLLSHPMEEKVPLSELKDDIEASDMLTKYSIKVLGLHIEKGAYHKMLGTLVNAGYVEADKPLPKDKNFPTLFKFFYDWRRDISENAAKLHYFILAKRKLLQQKYRELYGIENFDVQFDVVAHSLGGLVSRYYLRYGSQILPEDYSQPELTWEGQKYIDKLFMVGTPNGGYFDTLIELINGLKVINRGPVFPPSVICTFPSYYQMMPYFADESISYCGNPNIFINIYDYKTWEKFNWGFANPRQSHIIKSLLPEISSSIKRYKTALDHLNKCLKKAEQFHKSLVDYTHESENPVTTYLFIGNAVETSRCLDIDKNGFVKVTKYEAGDGKVLKASALMDKREITGWAPFLESPAEWQTVVQIEAAHMGITESNTFSDNLIYYLLHMPSKRYYQRMKYIKSLL
ncbi:MAG: hypothetical protein K9L78_03340 [Victivallales bacterium]|nr:hypothetical protein [Victivallales bacterium]MCF7889133.1 hypothetical protein [Victivallales bacterium]